MPARAFPRLRASARTMKPPKPLRVASIRGGTYAGRSRSSSASLFGAGAKVSGRGRMHMRHRGVPSAATGCATVRIPRPVQSRTAAGRSSAPLGRGARLPAPARAFDPVLAVGSDHGAAVDVPPPRVIFASASASRPPPAIAATYSATGARAGTWFCARTFRSSILSASNCSTKSAAARIAAMFPRSRSQSSSSSAASETRIARGARREPTSRRRLPSTPGFESPLGPLAAARIASATRRATFGATLCPRGEDPSADACRCARPVCGLGSNHRFSAGGGNANGASSSSRSRRSTDAFGHSDASQSKNCVSVSSLGEPSSRGSNGAGLAS